MTRHTPNGRHGDGSGDDRHGDGPDDDRHGDGSGDRRRGERPGSSSSARATVARTRRDVLRAAGVGVASAAVAGAGPGVAGTAAAQEGIPTPWLEREGNLLVDPQGSEVILRGVNVVDPARAVATQWREPLEEVIDLATNGTDDWYARVIRVPIQPADVADEGEGYGAEPEPGAFDADDLEHYCETYLDPVVEHCADVGVYCIVDYHRHRNDYTVYWDDPGVDEELELFWDVVAPRYAEESHVLYEVYNEPIGPYPGHENRDVEVGVLDPEAEATWDAWREVAQPWVDTIREHAPRNVVIVGSPRWSQWTYWAAEGQEFTGENLAYAGHVYGHPNLRPLADYFGEPAEDVPVFLSEFGWDGTADADYISGTAEVEGQQFVDLFEEYPIHWQAWCFDYIWEPTMVTEEYEVLGGDLPGELVRDYLLETRDQDVPGGEPDGDCPDAEGGSMAVDGQTVCDVNDDGYFRDVNGDGNVGNRDVGAFFENFHLDAWDREAFDYSGNGRVSHGDVVALFDHVV